MLSESNQVSSHTYNLSYMAKAPTTAQAFDGSGQVWFKILDMGPTFDSSGNAAWPLLTTYTANIPAALPSGEYLLRIQQLGIHNPYPAGTPQFYIECAQVSITNGGSGTPGPLVSIPGFIDGTEPGYTVNIYTNFHNYTVPGPAVWNPSGGGSTATAVPPPVHNHLNALRVILIRSLARTSCNTSGAPHKDTSPFPDPPAALTGSSAGRKRYSFPSPSFLFEYSSGKSFVLNGFQFGVEASSSVSESELSNSSLSLSQNDLLLLTVLVAFDVFLLILS